MSAADTGRRDRIAERALTTLMEVYPSRTPSALADRAYRMADAMIGAGGKAPTIDGDKLLDALATALPFVECAADDPAYKPGAVAKVVARLRALVEAGVGDDRPMTADAAINFAIGIDDHYARLEFLTAWRDGDFDTVREFVRYTAEDGA